MADFGGNVAGDDVRRRTLIADANTPRPLPTAKGATAHRLQFERPVRRVGRVKCDLADSRKPPRIGERGRRSATRGIAIYQHCGEGSASWRLTTLAACSSRQHRHRYGYGSSSEAGRGATRQCANPVARHLVCCRSPRRIVSRLVAAARSRLIAIFPPSPPAREMTVRRIDRSGRRSTASANLGGTRCWLARGQPTIALQSPWSKVPRAMGIGT
jgi:hypothetical protein